MRMNSAKEDAIVDGLCWFWSPNVNFEGCDVPIRNVSET